MITHYVNDSSNSEWRRALIDMENDYENAEIIVPLSGDSAGSPEGGGAGQLSYPWILRRQAT